MLLKSLHDQSRIGMRSRQWLWHDGIDNTQLLAVKGGQFQLLRDLPGFLRIPIQDGGRSFRRDNLVNRILQHQNVVSDSECYSSSAGTLADDNRHDWHGQTAHGREAMG